MNTLTAKHYTMPTRVGVALASRGWTVINDPAGIEQGGFRAGVQFGSDDVERMLTQANFTIGTILKHDKKLFRVVWRGAVQTLKEIKMGAIKTEEELESEWGLERTAKTYGRLSRWMLTHRGQFTVDDLAQLSKDDPDAYALYSARVWKSSGDALAELGVSHE